MRNTRLAVLAAVLTTLVFAPAANAKRVPCVLGEKSPKCLAWTAKFHLADDGDTVKARILNGKKFGEPERVRLTGIQAPELFNYSRKSRRGACLGVEAAETLEHLVHNSTGRLVAQKANSRSVGDTRVRLRRSLQIKRGGKWIDPAAELLKKGLALWFPNGQEWAWNGRYGRLAEEAAAKGIGIWNPVACGKPGPSQSSPLTIKPKWDGENKDRASGEWIRITNHDPFNDVPLAGWAVRDSHLRGDKHQPGYKFPSGAVIPAAGSITVNVGRGSNTANTFYWGFTEKETVFENATNDKKQAGDGAYLFDPNGELRAYAQYPCRTSCSEPLGDEVSVKARYQGLEHEWVTLTNNSDAPINLYQYELENSPWFYEFGPRDVLQPGSSIVVWVGEPHPVPAVNGSRVLLAAVPGVFPFAEVQSAGFRSWNHAIALLNDGADAVLLRNPLGMPVPGACDAWGSARCPSI
ncbi:MAG: lamin tail domain-containing protein [Thermoleophilaceae bacterium]